MSSSPQNPLPDSFTKATSELNNLVHIISGTTTLIEKSSQGSEAKEYAAMLRASVQRLENAAAEMIKQAGGASEKSITNPNLAAFAKKSAAPSTERKTSLLIVDDEQMALTLMSKILAGAGYQVTTAQSGFECLDHIRRRPFDFDLILLDLTMPFMDGEETFNRIREIRQDLPVILCTGFVQQERLKKLLDIGLAGFLRKPVAPDEVVTQIRTTLVSVKYSRGRVDPNNIPAAI